jgi:hypothetical protein
LEIEKKKKRRTLHLGLATTNRPISPFDPLAAQFNPPRALSLVGRVRVAASHPRSPHNPELSARALTLGPAGRPLGAGRGRLGPGCQAIFPNRTPSLAGGRANVAASGAASRPSLCVYMWTASDHGTGDLAATIPENTGCRHR